MNAKVSDMATDGATNGVTQTPWNLLAEFGRQQFAVAAQNASVMYRAREAVGAVQQQAAHEASAWHAETARRLHAPCALGDFLALQSELTRDNLLGVGRY